MGTRFYFTSGQVNYVIEKRSLLVLQLKHAFFASVLSLKMRWLIVIVVIIFGPHWFRKIDWLVTSQRMEIDKAIRQSDDRRLKTKYNNAIYVIQRALALYTYASFIFILAM